MDARLHPPPERLRGEVVVVPEVTILSGLTTGGRTELVGVPTIRAGFG
jgi:hypothetical protein